MFHFRTGDNPSQQGQRGNAADLIAAGFRDVGSTLPAQEQSADKARTTRWRILVDDEPIERVPHVPDLAIVEDTIALEFIRLCPRHTLNNGRHKVIIAGRLPVKRCAEIGQRAIGHHDAVVILHAIEQGADVSAPQVVDRARTNARPHEAIKGTDDVVSTAQIPGADIALDVVIEHGIDRAAVAIAFPIGGGIVVVSNLASAFFGNGARLICGDGAVKAKAQPMLPAVRRSVFEIVGDDTARQSSSNKAFYFTVGDELAALQFVDGVLCDLVFHGRYLRVETKRRTVTGELDRSLPTPDLHRAKASSVGRLLSVIVLDSHIVSVQPLCNIAKGNIGQRLATADNARILDCAAFSMPYSQKSRFDRHFRD
ncbi:MAG: hypothetical protein WBO12_15610, partial [Xanthobacteraceae bacterium]